MCGYLCCQCVEADRFLVTSIKPPRNESCSTISETTSLQRYVYWIKQKKKGSFNSHHSLLDPNCDPRRCAVPNCGTDSISGTLQGDCCERCIPLEYAQAIGLLPRRPQAVQDPRPAQPQDPYQPQYNQAQDPYQQQYNQQQYNQPQYNPGNRVDVYVFGPDDGARVSSGQSIYFDCEIVSPYNQNIQPRWSRSGNQVDRLISPRHRIWRPQSVPFCSHSHIKHRAQISPVTVKFHVSRFQMRLRATPVAMNAALVQVTRPIKLPLIYKWVILLAATGSIILLFDFR